jgi:hypothetical protein
MSRTKRRIIGMAGGTLWMISVSTGFATLSLVLIATRTATLALAGLIVAALLLLAVNVGAMRAARGVPGAVPPPTLDDQAMMRSFFVIVGVEIAALAVVNMACRWYGRDGLMTPLDLIVVGLHFVALARVFGTPRYAVMGGLMCAVPIATMLVVPEAMQVGYAPAWFVIPSLLCPLVVWLTSAANLREIFQAVREVEHAAVHR